MSAFTVTRNPVAFRSLTTNVSRGRSNGKNPFSTPSRRTKRHHRL